MRIAFVVVILSLISSIAFSKTIHVPGDYSKIQEAIDTAMDGDTVLVHPGTYGENINFLGKAIMVKSSNGPQWTTVDGGQTGSVVTFQSGEQPDSILEGFTLMNGSGTLLQGLGGGVLCSGASPKIVSNIITGNAAISSLNFGRGGGIYCNNSDSPMITNNTISGNSAADYGGGIYALWSSPWIIHNLIVGNSTGTEGGGICCWYSDSVCIANNIISGNNATGGIFSQGGGISYLKSSSTIEGNTLSENSADTRASGIYTKNSMLDITNTILWNKDAPVGQELYIHYLSVVNIGYSDLEGGMGSVYVNPNATLNWGPGMINADPIFVDPSNGDFHLTYPSPCKDTGDNSAGLYPEDFEGDPRIAYGIVDMGADEFYTHLYWAGDATAGGSVELKFVGLPGTTPVQLWLGSGVMDPPMTTKYGDWYLQFPLLANVGLGTIPTYGVLVFPFTFPANTPTPLTLPFQSGIGMELTNLLCMQIQ